MCERKPGPRCSADSHRELVNARQELQAFEAKFPYADRDWEKHSELKNKVAEAELKYYATPDGIEVLTTRRAEARDSELITSRVFGGVWEGNEAKHRLEIKVPAYVTLDADIDAAEGHRHSQKYLLSVLTDSEKNANPFLRTPLEQAEDFKQRLTAEQEQLTKALSEASEKQRAEANALASIAEARGVEVINLTDDTFDTSALKDAISQRRFRDRYLAYLNLRLEDINAYIKSVSSK